MRRLRCPLTLGASSIVCGLRYARARNTKRQTTDRLGDQPQSSVQGDAGHASDELPQLRPTEGLRRPVGFVSAESPSIASVRAEIDAMRREKLAQAFAENEAKKLVEKKSELQAASKSHDALGEANNLSPLREPSFRLTDKSIAEGADALRFLRDRRLMNDADDILRKKKRGDTMRLVKFLPCVQLSEERAERHSATEALFAAVTELRKRAATEGKVVSDNDLVCDAVLNADDQTVRLWVKYGLVDPLWWVEQSPPLDGGGDQSATGTTTSKQSAVDQEEEELMEEWLRTRSPHEILAACGPTQEATSTIKESLHALPSEDLAPTILKAQQEKYESISEREIKQLEAYEQQGGDVKGKALSSTSPLLMELSKYDAKIRKSLDILDRVKRESLLDKEFQAAVEYAKAVERTERAAIVRLQPNTRRQAAEIPYFFGTESSRPPPSADMNLPQPALSKVEKRQLQRQKKLKYLRRRYQQ